MAGPELLLDSNIRLWVVLPIVIITFFVGMIRHYVSILLQSDKKLTQEQVSDSQVLIRSRVLRENGKYIPKQSFLTRKYYFNNPEDGFFKKTKRKVVPPSPMTDPTMLTDMMKGNVTNVLPMILIGGWINMTFSGFVTTKVPFPLTLRFKPMLQQGIELLTLDASWCTSKELDEKWSSSRDWRRLSGTGCRCHKLRLKLLCHDTGPGSVDLTYICSGKDTEEYLHTCISFLAVLCLIKPVPGNFSTHAGQLWGESVWSPLLESMPTLSAFALPG